MDTSVPAGHENSKTAAPPRLSVRAAFFLFFILGAMAASLGISLPFLKSHFNLNENVGYFITFYNFGAFLGTVSIGLVSGRIRTGKLLLFFMILTSCGTALLGTVGRWEVFLAAALTAGTGHGGLNVLINACFAESFKKNNIVMINLLNAVFGIGAVTGALLLGYIPAEFFRLIFLIVSGGTLLSFPCIFWYKSRSSDVHSAGVSSGSSSAAAYPMRIFFVCFGIAFLYAGLETSIGAFYALQLSMSGWTPAHSAIAGSTFWLGLALGRLCLPRIVSRFLTGERSPALYFLMCSAVLIAGYFFKNTAVIFPLAGFFISPILPTLFACVSRLTANPQRILSFVTLFAMTGNFVIPTLVQLGLDSAAAVPIILSFAVIAVTGLVAALILTAVHKADAGRE